MSAALSNRGSEASPREKAVLSGGGVLAILRMECFVTGEAGKPVNEGGFTGLVDSLAPHFDRVEVIAPVVERLEVSGDLQPFQSENVVFRALPDMKGVLRSWWRSREACRLLDQWVGDWDVVNLRAPDNFLPAAGDYLRERGTPHYVQLVSHPFDAANSSVGALSPALRPVGRLAWDRQTRAIAKACKQRLCIAHGESLRSVAQDFGARAFNLPSGSLRRKWVSSTTRSGQPKKLLFVGRINAEKGIDVLIRALGLLGDLDLEVSLVGWSSGDYAERMSKLARELGVEGRLRFLGPTAHGEALFQAYRDHDMFVLPSVSEGTPRVIGEAMAFGLPVVATTAGGIPDLVESEVTGLLVAPRSSEELAAAIRRIVRDDDLRNKLVAAATETVDERTLEFKAEQHVKLVRENWDAVEVELAR